MVQANNIITVFSKEIPKQIFSQLLAYLDKATIMVHATRILSTEIHSYNCVELSVECSNNSDCLTKLSTSSCLKNADIVIQNTDLYHNKRGLIAFDMDSTLISIEGIDELAALAGKGKEVQEITAQAMRGEIDFATSLTKRTAFLNGLSEDTFLHIANNLPLTEGCERLLNTLHNLGIKTAVISGGFTSFARALQHRLGISHVFANDLEIRNGNLTGRIIGPIVDATSKADKLRQLATSEGLNLAQTIAVGDGANDLLMLQVAGLGVAFRGTPVVQDNADCAFSVPGLDGVLYLLGMSDYDINTLKT